MIRALLVAALCLFALPLRADNLSGLPVLTSEGCDAITPAEWTKLKELLAGLDSPSFPTREKATRELALLLGGILERAPGAASCLFGWIDDNVRTGSAEVGARLGAAREGMCEVAFPEVPRCDGFSQASPPWNTGGKFVGGVALEFPFNGLASFQGPSCSAAADKLRHALERALAESAQGPTPGSVIVPSPDSVTASQPGCCRVTGCTFSTRPARVVLVVEPADPDAETRLAAFRKRCDDEGGVVAPTEDPNRAKFQTVVGGTRYFCLTPASPRVVTPGTPFEK